jgi:hypothetical protein
MITYSLTLLGRNSLLPIENEEGFELGKELQVVVQVTSDCDTKTKGVVTINLHNQGRGKHESEQNLDWNGGAWRGVVWREGCTGCAQRLGRKTRDVRDQSAYRKASDWRWKSVARRRSKERPSRQQCSYRCRLQLHQRERRGRARPRGCWRRC